MLFNAKHFEQFFDEKNLKKGLSLFLKGRVETIVIQASPELFFLADGKEISIKTKGEKVLSYTCSCKAQYYCSHLSAALFYLQKDSFDGTIKDQDKKQIRKVEESFKKENELLVKRKRNDLSLIGNFIQKQKRQVYLPDVLPLLSEHSSLTSYDLYTVLLEHLLENFLVHERLNEKQINDLNEKLSSFIEKSATKAPKEQYYLHLALSMSFVTLFHLRYAGDEIKLRQLYKNSCNKLDAFFTKGLSVIQEDAWLSALMRSVETNKNLESGIFAFLLPRWVSVTKSKQKLWQLGQTLQKRHLKVQYSQRLDKLLTAKLMVYLRESKLFETALPLIAGEDSVELIIAKAELNFYSGKINTAFKILETDYEEVKKNRAHYYQEYLDYILFNAANRSYPEIEIKYLRESFLNGLFILPEQLRHFLSLISKEKRKEEITHLLKDLKRNPFNYSFDKVVVVLWEDKRWDELILEIKKQKNKFQLLHEVLMNKLPDYSLEGIKLYAKHLISSVLEKEFYPYQIELINKATEYLNKLPEEETEQFMLVVLNGLLKQSQVYRYLKEKYDFE